MKKEEKRKKKEKSFFGEMLSIANELTFGAIKQTAKNIADDFGWTKGADDKKKVELSDKSIEKLAVAIEDEREEREANAQKFRDEMSDRPLARNGRVQEREMEL